MQVTMNRQDLQGALDFAKNRIIERMVSRQDLQKACDTARDRVLSCMQDFYQNHQQLIRQTSVQTDQQTRRIASMESRIAVMDQEMKIMRQLMVQMIEEQRQTAGMIAAIPNALAAANVRAKESPADHVQAQYGTAFYR
jgi:TolA-binding protein